MLTNFCNTKVCFRICVKICQRRFVFLEFMTGHFLSNIFEIFWEITLSKIFFHLRNDYSKITFLGPLPELSKRLKTGYNLVNWVQVHSVHSRLRYNFCKFWLYSSYKLRLSVFWLPDPCEHPIWAYLLSRVSYLAAATTTETQLFYANNLAGWGTDHHLEKSISHQFSISFRECIQNAISF